MYQIKMGHFYNIGVESPKCATKEKSKGND